MYDSGHISSKNDEQNVSKKDSQNYIKLFKEI
jgi:hypothetical protein